MRFENVTFKNQAVRLDGNEFEGCTFQKCELVYAAEGVVSMRETRAQDCTWKFADAAARTIQFLTAFYPMGGGAKEMIEATFNNIRQGRHPHAGPLVQ